MPEWIWSRDVLSQIAVHMRAWHDATSDFSFGHAQWSFHTDTEHQVICHNDFAPYNCVFREHEFAGLIDFDLCAPGSRLWDMSSTAYRFIPVMPYVAFEAEDEKSPFDMMELHIRMDLFLNAYSKKTPCCAYTREELLRMITKRLSAISEWSRKYAEETKNDALLKNALRYKRHAKWVCSMVRNMHLYDVNPTPETSCT